jgi:hypothetical protein
MLPWQFSQRPAHCKQQCKIDVEDTARVCKPHVLRHVEVARLTAQQMPGCQHATVIASVIS